MKYDIKKAMREHPEECELLILEAMTHAHMWGFGHDAAADRIRETCKVQTLQEAKEALVTFCERELYQCTEPMEMGPRLATIIRKLTNDVRAARARENKQ